MSHQGNHYQDVWGSAADITATVKRFYETFPFPGRMKVALDATG